MTLTRGASGSGVLEVLVLDGLRQLPVVRSRAMLKELEVITSRSAKKE